ncbi:GNAT family N-acetyltransferase [bacterium]|nr:GNAT family N-acetyltransferase [bacterium]
MEEKESKQKGWLNWLQDHEENFNEELHLLLTQGVVKCLPSDGYIKGAGWFLRFADVEAGEWNLAHPFGSVNSYVQFLRDIPASTFFHLLVPIEDLETLKQNGVPDPEERLIWHRDILKKPEKKLAETSSSLPPGFQGELKFFETPNEDGLWNLKGYLLKNNSIVSLVKPIHVTPHTVEVYIETAASFRGMGLGTWLLAEYRKRLRVKGFRMVYVSSETNFSSRMVAKKIGLEPYQVLARIPFSNPANSD